MLPQRNALTTIQDALPIQWANGRTEIRATPTEKFTTGRVGFHAECGLNPAFDAFARKYDLPVVDIRHPRAGAPAEVIRHWWLGDAIGVIPITSGPVADTLAGCLRQAQATANAGIGARWPQGEKSRLAVRVYVVIEVGEKRQRQVFPQPVQLTTRSKLTEALLAALVAHSQVCARADVLWERKGDPVGCYELLLPLVAGEEQEWGKGADKTAVTPFVCQHPAADAIDTAYLDSVRCSRTLLQVVERDWPGVQQWAQQVCFGGQAEAQPAVEQAA